MTKMKLGQAEPAFAEPMPEGERSVKIVAGFEVTKLVHDYVPIVEGLAGTFGDALDAYLIQCVREGQQVQSIELVFTPDQWREVAERLNPS